MPKFLDTIQFISNNGETCRIEKPVYYYLVQFYGMLNSNFTGPQFKFHFFSSNDYNVGENHALYPFDPQQKQVFLDLADASLSEAYGKKDFYLNTTFFKNGSFSKDIMFLWFTQTSYDFSSGHYRPQWYENSASKGYEFYTDLPDGGSTSTTNGCQLNFMEKVAIIPKVS